MIRFAATVSESTAIQRAVNYRGAKAGFQQSVTYIVEQLLHGNADAVYRIMRAAEMLIPKPGKDGVKMYATKDGRALWQYLTDPTENGGLGLSGIVRWDSDSQSHKMAENWQDAANKLNLGLIWSNLKTRRWDMHGKMKADRAFDLNERVKRLIAEARKNGITGEQITAAVSKALN
jgi:hypothetical protein